MNDKPVSQKHETEGALLNLEEKSDQELRKILDQLYKEEQEISYRRRLLHGKIDILRAELTERLARRHKSGESIITKEDVKKLSKILSQGAAKYPKSRQG